MGNKTASAMGHKLNAWRKDKGPKPPRQPIPCKAARKQKHGGKR